MIDITKLKDPSPWHPITDPVDLKHLGKLLEELVELNECAAASARCAAATARCIIQGINEKHPVTEKENKEWLEDEIADVYANLALVKERFGLNTNRIFERMNHKIKHLSDWHRMA